MGGAKNMKTIDTE